jgi:hypothetical protein
MIKKIPPSPSAIGVRGNVRRIDSAFKQDLDERPLAIPSDLSLNITLRHLF